MSNNHGPKTIAAASPVNATTHLDNSRPFPAGSKPICGFAIRDIATTRREIVESGDGLLRTR